jgi:hypothetical protein
VPDLPQRHAWAAEGLAHTCYISYVDSRTGLGPDQLEFKGRSIGEKWAERVDQWEKAGGHGGVPPGVNQATPVSGNQWKEYVTRDPYNPLRPEVSIPTVFGYVFTCLMFIPSGSRRSRAFTSSGALRRTQNGVVVAGNCFRQSKHKGRLSMVLPVCLMWTSTLLR